VLVFSSLILYTSRLPVFVHIDSILYRNYEKHSTPGIDGENSELAAGFVKDMQLWAVGWYLYPITTHFSSYELHMSYPHILLCKLACGSNMHPYVLTMCTS
jgi:hypothetical protein